MNLFDDSLAPRTQFDLNFRIVDIPVRVHPYFWLSVLLMSQISDRRENALLYLALWAAILFVSILVHELGHVLMGRFFGSRGHIVLTGFCGLAIGSANLPERWQRNLVSFAGPAAGFLLGGAVIGASMMRYPDYTLFTLGRLIDVDVLTTLGGGDPSEMVRYIISNLLWVNLFWGLINLLPIWPLDGGQVCREFCESRRGRDGLRLSLQISLFTSIGFAVLGLAEFVAKKPIIPHVSLGGTLFSAIFFGILAYTSWRVLQVVQQGGSDGEDDDPGPCAPWERDADWWKR